MADAEENEEKEGGEEEGAEKPKSRFSLNLQPLWFGIGRIIWMGAVGVIVMGTYVVGTRYELGGYRKPFKIDRITGKVSPAEIPRKTIAGGFTMGQYYLKPAQISALKRMAKDKNRDVSELVREIVDKYLEAVVNAQETRKNSSNKRSKGGDL